MELQDLYKRLDTICNVSKKNNKVEGLYRLLKEECFYEIAIKNLMKNHGAMTAGVSGLTIEGLGTIKINKLIEKINKKSYFPTPVKRVYIPKQGNDFRPLGIPSAEDKIIQEMCRIILECVFEQHMSNYSHGFRRGRSCHTAVTQIQKVWIGVKWWGKIDIEKYFDSIDHNKLINILEERIDDNAFISLINKFLKSGYLEDWKFHKTLSGTPQGGIVSPILSNIFLDKLDKYIESKMTSINIKKERKKNDEYSRIESKIFRLRQKYNTSKDPDIRNKISELNKIKFKTPSKDPYDKEFRRLRYVRYADDFILGYIGPKTEFDLILNDIQSFISNMNLSINKDKSMVSHSSDRIRFLGFDLMISFQNHGTNKSINNIQRRTLTGRPRLLTPRDRSLEFIVKHDYANKRIATSQIRNKDIKHRSYLLNNDVLEIIETYNAELRGLANYYKVSENMKDILSLVEYASNYSLLKTLANKFKTSIKEVCKKYLKNGRIIFEYIHKNKNKNIQQFKLKDIKDRNEVKDWFMLEFIKNKESFGCTSKLDRINLSECSICGSHSGPFEIHHINHLKSRKKNISRKTSARSRKWIVLCVPCHTKIHNK